MAKKRLTQRVAERVEREKTSQAARNRAQFLAQRDEILEALDDGWPMKTVWQTLRSEGAITFGYDAFVRYVRKLATPKSPVAVLGDVAASEAQPAARPKRRQKSESPAGARGTNKPGRAFIYAPEADKDDLIG
jgi:hypothetical protein